MFARRIELLRKTLFLTTNSRKQTTPWLVRNPNLTKAGVILPKPKSYKYDLTAPHIVNKHLYWNRTEQNKILRNQHRLRRFKRLGIRPLYKDSQKVVERPLAEILRELRDRRLIMQSTGRTLGNILELLKRFGSEAQQYKDLLVYAFGELNKQVALMTFREFSMYILILQKTKQQPNLQLFTHFYHHLLSAETVNTPLKIELFARMCQFFFDGKTQYPESLQHKDPTPFKMFEDNDPRIRSFEEIVNTLYGPSVLPELVKGSKIPDSKKLAGMLKNAPGKLSTRLEELA